MKKQYKIGAIVHSGRKGMRATPVTESKYDGLVGTSIWFDVDSMKQFEEQEFLLIDNPFYEYWRTSAVLQAGIDENNQLIIETVNTIYILEELDGQGNHSRAYN